MKYTFEISVAGCATTCAHCYVSGGFAPAINADKFEAALVRLGAVIDGLGGDVAVTLGNEVFVHPRCLEILDIAHKILPTQTSYKNMGGGIPTTALALMKHRDGEAIVRKLAQMGCFAFDFSLLGGRDSHNKLVQNSGAYDCLRDFARWVTDLGLELGINLMVCKPLIAILASVVHLRAKNRRL